MRILLVDDDTGLSMRTSMLLRRAGYSVITASNGVEALALLHSNEKAPDLILLDLSMPLMDGWRFREIQLRHEGLRDVPVVVLSEAPIGAAYQSELAPNGVLLKPFEPRDLFRQLTAFVSARKEAERPSRRDESLPSPLF